MRRLVVAGLLAAGLSLGPTQPAVAQGRLEISDVRDQKAEFPFGDSRGSRKFEFTIRPRPPLESGQEVTLVPASGLISEENSRISFRQVTGEAVPDPIAPELLRATITVALPDDVNPGRYTGSVNVTARGYEPVNVPVQATLQKGVVWAVLMALLGFTGGAILKVAADLYRTEDLAIMKLGTWRYWKRRGTLIWSIVLGLVGAGLAFYSGYLLDDNWGAVAEDFLKLAAAAATAVVTGSTVTDFWDKVTKSTKL